MKIALLGNILFQPDIIINNPWVDIDFILNKYDIVIGNLETPLTEAEIPWLNKNNIYKTNPENNKFLYPFNCISIANDHILDYRKKGLEDTINILNKKYILSGASIDQDTIKMINNKICILSISTHPHYFSNSKSTYIESDGQKFKYKGTEGINWININDYKDFLQVIKDLRLEFPDNIILISIHNDKLNDLTEKMYKDFIDNGANVIYGHGCNNISKIEKYKNGIIFYDLGTALNQIEEPSCMNCITGIGVIEFKNTEIIKSHFIPYLNYNKATLIQNKKMIKIIEKFVF